MRYLAVPYIVQGVHAAVRYVPFHRSYAQLSQVCLHVAVSSNFEPWLGKFNPIIPKLFFFYKSTYYSQRNSRIMCGGLPRIHGSCTLRSISHPATTIVQIVIRDTTQWSNLSCLDSCSGWLLQVWLIQLSLQLIFNQSNHHVIFAGKQICTLVYAIMIVTSFLLTK